MTTQPDGYTFALNTDADDLYRQEMARRGFVALAYDPSYNGESGGEPRHTEVAV